MDLSSTRPSAQKTYLKGGWDLEIKNIVWYWHTPQQQCDQAGYVDDSQEANTEMEFGVQEAS